MEACGQGAGEMNVLRKWQVICGTKDTMILLGSAAMGDGIREEHPEDQWFD